MPQITKEITINNAIVPIDFDIEYSLRNTKLDISSDFLEQLGPWTQEYCQVMGKISGRTDGKTLLLDEGLEKFIIKKARSIYGKLVYDITIRASIECESETRKQLKIFEIDYRTFVADVETTVYFIGKINENVFACLDKQLEEKSKKWLQEEHFSLHESIKSIPFVCDECTVIAKATLLRKIGTQLARARAEIMLSKCLVLFPIVALFIGFIPTTVAVVMFWMLLKNNFSCRNELAVRLLVIISSLLILLLMSFPVAVKLAKAYVSTQDAALVGWIVFFSGLPSLGIYRYVLGESVGVCPV